MRSLCGALILLAVTTLAKDLHFKETNTETSKDNQNNFLDFYYYDDNLFTEKERFARHVELVTESVLEHLLTEIKAKYAHQNNSDSNIPKFMNRLKMKMMKMNKKKVKKHKKKVFHFFDPTTVKPVNETEIAE